VDVETGELELEVAVKSQLGHGGKTAIKIQIGLSDFDRILTQLVKDRPREYAPLLAKANALAVEKLTA
jgi:hypothetical protein